MGGKGGGPWVRSPRYSPPEETSSLNGLPRPPSPGRPYSGPLVFDGSSVLWSYRSYWS